MVKCPEIGVTYYEAVEWWGTPGVLPVKLTEINLDYGEDGAVWRGVTILGENYIEDDDFIQPKDLFLTEDEALESIGLGKGDEQ